MGYGGCKTELDAMREIYIIAVLNHKTDRNECPLLFQDPDKAEFKTGDMVLSKNHVATNAFDTNYKPSFRICKCIFDKAFVVQDSAGKVRHVYTTCLITTSVLCYIRCKMVNIPSWYKL